MTPADIKLAVHQFQEAIKASANGTISVTMDVRHAQMFIDFLQHMDPDMPSAALCKALGPLVGDMMMNIKLHRLDELADKLGVAALLLAGEANRRATK